MAATFQLPSTPGRSRLEEEWADFWELICLTQEGQFVNSRRVLAPVNVASDEEEIGGINEGEDEIEDSFIGYLEELKNRKQKFESHYPFDVSTNSLRYKGVLNESTYLYLYLLLVTRSNMNNFRHLGEVDGTLIFEELCKIVLSRYFGPKSQSFLFGTSITGTSFKSKVEDLILRTGVGVRFESHENAVSTQKDDGIDVVAYIDFYDKEESKLVAFGQCKTGVNWRDSIGKLDPETFSKNWFWQSPYFTPIKVVMLADVLTKQRNFRKDQVAANALFFTRFRLLEYLTEPIDPELFLKIKNWVDARLKLPFF